MKIAKDGLPFDIDNNVDVNFPSEEGYVELIQYLRPSGKRRRMIANVGKELAKKAENMILSCEELTTGEIALYARWQDQGEESEIMELADNGPGEREPTKMLVKLIQGLSLDKK